MRLFIASFKLTAKSFNPFAMKKIIEAVVRRRNPDFSFADEASSWMLLGISKGFALNQLRALRLLQYGKRPLKRFIGRRLKIVSGRRVHLGQWVKIGDHCVLSAFGTEGIQIGDRSGIGDFSRLVVSTDLSHPGKGISLGRNVGIGEFAYLGGAGGLEIGDDCIIGQYFSCHPENHHFHDFETPIRMQGVSQKGIRIGANCWIGAKVTILDGVEIGEGCVIAAGAVVTKSMPARSVIGGVPARVIRSRETSWTPNRLAV